VQVSSVQNPKCLPFILAGSASKEKPGSGRKLWSTAGKTTSIWKESSALTRTNRLEHRSLHCAGALQVGNLKPLRIWVSRLLQKTAPKCQWVLYVCQLGIDNRPWSFVANVFSWAPCRLLITILATHSRPLYLNITCVTTAWDCLPVQPRCEALAQTFPSRRQLFGTKQWHNWSNLICAVVRSTYSRTSRQPASRTPNPAKTPVCRSPPCRGFLACHVGSARW